MFCPIIWYSPRWPWLTDCGWWLCLLGKKEEKFLLTSEIWETERLRDSELSCRLDVGVGWPGPRSVQSFTSPPVLSGGAGPGGGRWHQGTAVVVSEPQPSSCQTSRVHISLSKTVQTWRSPPSPSSSSSPSLSTMPTLSLDLIFSARYKICSNLWWDSSVGDPSSRMMALRLLRPLGTTNYSQMTVAEMKIREQENSAFQTVFFVRTVSCEQ